LAVYAILDDGNSISRSVTVEMNSGEIQPLADDHFAIKASLFSEQVFNVAYAFDRRVEVLSEALRD